MQKNRFHAEKNKHNQSEYKIEKNEHKQNYFDEGRNG